jgi:hypothetical protein
MFLLSANISSPSGLNCECRKPTPWSRIIFEKLIVSQLLRKFATFYVNQRFITMLTRIITMLTRILPCSQESYPSILLPSRFLLFAFATKLKKYANYLSRVCLSVRPSVTCQGPLKWNLILRALYKVCGHFRFWLKSYKDNGHFILLRTILDFVHRPYVIRPQRFEGWLFPRLQVNLIWWVRSIELASIGGHWVLSTLAIHSSCAKIWLWVTKWRDNIKFMTALLPSTELVENGIKYQCLK